MRVINQAFEMVPVATLHTHPLNPRRGNVAVIAESVKTNGFYGAVVVQQSTNYILAGNHRYLAAIQEQADEIPVLWVDVSDEEAKRIILADNKTSDLADYDEQSLGAILAELVQTELGLTGTGYGSTEADEILASLAGEWDEDVVNRGHQKRENGSDAIERVVVHAPRSIIGDVKTAIAAAVESFDGVTIE
jgi:ParB-like chromosome segregation protein Spo0J